ncbi:MAG: hypothetical protein ABJD68_05015 [Nakamurella sp.]
MTNEIWPVLGAQVLWDDADPSVAQFLFPADHVDRTAVLLLEQPVLAALIGDLAAVDDARAAASGYPREPRSPTASLASATAAQPPAESPDPTVIPIQQARTQWDPANPFDASLVFEVDGSVAALDLTLPVMTALLGDLATLNRRRAIQAGWTTDDDPEFDDEKRSLTGRFFATHTAVQSGLERLPVSWQAILAATVVVVIVLFAVIFG